MKSRSLLLVVLTLLAGSIGTAIVLSHQESTPSKDIRSLTLVVKTDKPSYLPGELITLDFKILNESQEAILLPKSVDVWSGHLQVFISDETNDYKMYKGPRWGLFKPVGVATLKLAPGDSFNSTATMLHNHTVETSHLTEDYKKQVSKGLIPTEYVLPQPGLYFIKAALIDDALENKVESEPVRIVIEEPMNADLEVWNKIKDDGNYARFMQTGALATPDPQKTKRIVETLEEIENSHSHSKYYGQIRSALAKQRDKDKLKKNQ
jgi:hypothetical protein